MHNRVEPLLRAQGDVEWADRLGRDRARIAACADLVVRLETAQALASVDGDTKSAEWFRLDLARLSSRDGYGLRGLLATLIAVSSGQAGDGELVRILGEVRDMARQMLDTTG